MAARKGHGSHNGTSLLETYISQMAGVWKTVIVTGSGNEGAGRGHASGVLENGKTETIEWLTGTYESKLNIQLWKQYADDLELVIRHPSGRKITIAQPPAGEVRIIREKAGTTELLIYYGTPVPYNSSQEIYLDLIPEGAYIDPGSWKLELIPKQIVNGRYDLWLPSEELLGRETGFFRPDPEVTLTIPSTAQKVITVGAYDAALRSYAYFSGRGYTRSPVAVKPDLVAPGVNVVTASPGGGYTVVSGTSFAAPFVAAAACLMMQWGIVEGKDRYLYGEKLKAFLIRGAGQLPGSETVPNEKTGWGALCVRDSLPD